MNERVSSIPPTPRSVYDRDSPENTFLGKSLIAKKQHQVFIPKLPIVSFNVKLTIVVLLTAISVFMICKSYVTYDTDHHRMKILCGANHFFKKEIVADNLSKVICITKNGEVINIYLEE